MGVVKILVLVLIVNSFFYLSGFHLFDNDILTRFVSLDEDHILDYAHGDSGEAIGSALPSDATTGGTLTTGTGGFSFVDALALVWDVIKFLLNIIFAPIGLLVAAGFPLFVQLGLGLPLGAAYIFGLIVLLRGGGA